MPSTLIISVYKCLLNYHLWNFQKLYQRKKACSFIPKLHKCSLNVNQFGSQIWPHTFGARSGSKLFACVGKGGGESATKHHVGISYLLLCKLLLVYASGDRLPGPGCQHAGKQWEQLAHIKLLGVFLDALNVRVEQRHPQLAVVHTEIIRQRLQAQK